MSYSENKQRPDVASKNTLVSSSMNNSRRSRYLEFIKLNSFYLIK